MKITFLSSSLASTFVFASLSYAHTVAGTISVKDKKEKDYPGLATVTLQEAVDAALASVPGKAIEAELDDEKGYLVYDVKVAGTDNKMHEVTVDAGNKSILKSKAK